MTPLERIVERIGRVGDVNEPGTPKPLVTLEEFFDGNEDPGSIGYNLPDPPAPQELYELFKRIRIARRPHALVVVLAHLHDDIRLLGLRGGAPRASQGCRRREEAVRRGALTLPHNQPDL